MLPLTPPPPSMTLTMNLVSVSLSKQSSLVINTVDTNDISRLPHLVTGLTEDGGGGGRFHPPPPLSCVHSSLCCF
jgi:hypothetical protein